MNLLSSPLLLALAEGGHDSFSPVELFKGASIANKGIIIILIVVGRIWIPPTGELMIAVLVVLISLWFLVRGYLRKR